jgi:preprotein translocase SecE subunit
MARTRQKAKQRKAKRLEQERKAAERAERAGGAPAPERARAPRRQETDRVEVDDARPDGGTRVEVEEPHPDSEPDIKVEDRRGLTEVEELEAAQQEAAAEIQEAQRAAEAASAPEAAPVPVREAAPEKVSRRERRKAEIAKEKKPKPAPRPERKREREARQRGRVVNFLIQVWAELRRVQWPDRAQVTQATAVVVVFCLLAGVYLGVWDFLFNKLVKALL